MRFVRFFFIQIFLCAFVYQVQTASYKKLLEENDNDIISPVNELDINYYIPDDFSPGLIDNLYYENKVLYFNMLKIYKKKIYAFVYECLVCIDKNLASEADNFLKKVLYNDSVYNVHKYIVNFISMPIKNLALQFKLDINKFYSVNELNEEFSKLFRSPDKIDTDTLNVATVLLFRSWYRYPRFNRLANSSLYFLLENNIKIYFLEMAIKMHLDIGTIQYLFDKGIKSKEECIAYADKYISIIKDALKDALLNYKDFYVSREHVINYLLSIHTNKSYKEIDDEIDDYCKSKGTFNEFASLYYFLPQDTMTITYICSLIEMFNKCPDFYRRIIKYDLLKDYMHVPEIRDIFKQLKSSSCAVM